MADATRTVVKQHWLESERGWGTRPDGYSLHLTDADRERYINAYWDKMPKYVPDKYERPYGDPEEVAVSDATYAKLEAAKGEFGIRVYRHTVL